MRKLTWYLKKVWPSKIRYQLVLGIALVQLLVISLFVSDLVVRQKNFLIRQNREQALSLSSDFAVNTASYIAANDLDALERLVYAHKNFPNLKYAMVLSPELVVLAHTDRNMVGLKAIDSVSRRIKPGKEMQILYENNYLLDIAVPILNNDEIVGWARVGLSQQYIYANLADITKNGVFYVIIAIIAGTLLALVFGSNISGSLYKLIATADKIKSGERKVRASSSRNFEISKLGTAFNEMLDEIDAKEKLTAMVLETMPVGVWLLDEQGYVISSNTAGRKIWGGEQYFDVGEFTNYKGWFTDTGKLLEAEDWGAAKAILYGATVINQELRIECFDKSNKIILNSAIPLLDDTGKVIGAIAVNVDITDRKKTEKDLMDYKYALDQSSLVTITNAQGIIQYVNKNFCKISKYRAAELIGKDHRIINSGYHPGAYMKQLWDTISSGNIWRGELKNKAKDGTHYWVDTTIVPFVDDGGKPYQYIAIRSDITDRKHAENRILKMHHDIEKRAKELGCLYRLSQLCNMRGVTKASILKDSIDIIASAYQYSAKTKVRVTLNSFKAESEDFVETPWKQHAPISASEGQIGCVEVVYTEQLAGEDEGPFLKEERLLINSVADIIGNFWERKKAERESLRLNRLYQFISQVNGTMLKSESADTIYEEACRIAVEYGKCRLAWIGLYDSTGESVIPAAWSGYEDGYLKEIQISSKDSDWGTGPTGNAIRNGSHYYCNDIANDPSMLPWREEALKRNYRSSISLPIIVDAKIVAVFTLYMSEPFFFNETEVKLLREVTDNIAYALDKLRIRDLQLKSERELRESEEKFRSLVEQSLIGVYIFQNNKFIYVNQGFEKISGYSKEELLGDFCLEQLIHADDVEKIKRNYALVTDGVSQRDQTMYRSITSDGVTIYVESIISGIIFNGKPALIGTIIDITGRMEEEQRIGKAVIDAQEKQRMQIGMELHDNVQQLMTGSLMSLSFIKKKLNNHQLVTETLDDIKEYITEAINELRRLSHQLTPSVCLDDSLNHMLEHFVHDVNKMGQLKVSMQAEEFNCKISEDKQLAIYRILQEQFNNIQKHAGASAVLINAALANDNIVFCIKDDGRGFDLSTRRKGIGLDNIRRRAQLSGGEAKIISEAGNGCEVHVRIPL